MPAEPPARVRLDKWLWAARFFKTRALAVEAVDGGKVRVNDDRVKRAKQVQVGDRVEIRLGPYLHAVVVQGLSERRGPAPEAAKLYQETPESVTERERVAFQLKAAHVLFVPEANERPTKRDRRRLEDFRKKSGWE
jgi:ribosome-associated heat shock protein Hsp15